MRPISVFDFDNLRDLLKYRIELSLVGSRGHKTSNLARFALSLGYRSPSILSMMIKGKRIPSEDMVSAMAKAWNLSPKEHDFLRLLVQLEREKKKGRDTSETFARLKRLASKKEAFAFSLNQYTAIRDWYYVVITQMVASPGFVEDANWISRKLRKKITPAQAARAIEVLLELGLVARDPETSRLMPPKGPAETTHDVPSEAIRQHHAGMIERGLEALQEQPIGQRHFNGLTLKVDPARIPEMKEKLLSFLRDFNTEFETQDSDRVYQLNLQLFEHTRGDESDAAH